MAIVFVAGLAGCGRPDTAANSRDTPQPVEVQGEQITRPSSIPSAAALCDSETDNGSASQFSFCGPAIAHIQVGSATLDLVGGSCEVGDTWFTANVGVLALPEAPPPLAGGYLTVSAGSFPPEFEVTTSTSTTIVKSNAGQIPDAAYIGTTTTLPIPVTGDGIVPGLPVVALRNGDRSFVVDKPELTLSNNRRSLDFQGVAFDSGERVVGSLNCTGQ